MKAANSAEPQLSISTPLNITQSSKRGQNRDSTKKKPQNTLAERIRSKRKNNRRQSGNPMGTSLYNKPTGDEASGSDYGVNTNVTYDF